MNRTKQAGATMSDKPKWTPGPWQIRRDKELVIITGGYLKITVSRLQDYGDPLPDGRLIAAAPLMAEALEKISNHMQAWSSSGDSRPAIWADGRIKIARAALRAAGDDNE